MYKLKKIFTIIITLTVYITWFSYARFWLSDSWWIYTTWRENAIAPITNENDTWSILHIWSRRIFWLWNNWEPTNDYWLVWTDQQFSDYNAALTKILTVIQNIVNYALWLLWVIALIYLIIHWFMIMTAGGDDSKSKKWFKWVKNAFLALGGIGLSWIIISFILWVINILAT